MNDHLTDITLVLDRSGSMQTIRNDTIGGVNAFLDVQKAAPGEARFTLAQFDDRYDVVHDAVPIASVPPLTDATFVPRGSTALLDAIGRTINATGARLGAMPEADRPGKVVFVIMTDGEENSSHEFTPAQIKAMTTHQAEKYAWEFVYLGANQDAITVGASLGVKASNAMSFAPANVAAVARGTSAKLARHRGGYGGGMAYSAEERAEAMADSTKKQP